MCGLKAFLNVFIFNTCIFSKSTLHTEWNIYIIGNF